MLKRVITKVTGLRPWVSGVGIGGKEDVDFLESHSELEKLANLLSVPVAWLQSSMNMAAAQNRKKLPVPVHFVASRFLPCRILPIKDLT